MIVLGGRDGDGNDLVGIEMYDEDKVCTRSQSNDF
jgi:hypothetical protein